MTDTKIPGNAVGLEAEDDDLVAPTQALLRSLLLLPESTDLNSGNALVAAFKGTPDSVSVIEAGATAASKWWSAAIAGGAIISSSSLRIWWTALGERNQPFALVALAITLAASALGVAYLLGSDVRGRAAATVATVQARQAIASALIAEAGRTRKPTAKMPALPIPLPGQVVTNGAKVGSAERGWKAIATREDEDGTAFLLVKGRETEWVPAKDVVFG